MSPATPQLYREGPDFPRPERRGASRLSVIEAAKKAVSLLELARVLVEPGSLRESGKEMVGRCPLPDHEDHVPSFNVNTEKNVWFCHGCLRGGDVIELARFAWGYDKDHVAMAAAQLLTEFGHDIPSKSRSWFRKQERQRPVRDAIKAERLRHMQRRVFRIFVPLIAEVPEVERREEAELLWDQAHGLATLILSAREAS